MRTSNSPVKREDVSIEKKKGKTKVNRLKRINRRAAQRLRINRKTFILLTVLRCLVVITMIRCIITKQYESVAICVLSLVLFTLPVLAEENLSIEIPPLFEAIIYLFIYAAEILGEINHYYVLIPGWDTMLHTMNGFLCAAVGFSMVDLLNQSSKKINLSPFYLTMVAFCFSMTVGVIWEFFEFFMDRFFMLDMQKDYLVQQFSSVTLDPAGKGALVKVEDITETLIKTASGKEYVVKGGYLDIGIIDTMKDLFVNFIGAIAFSIIGYLYVSNRSKNNLAEDLMIRKQTEEEKEMFQRVMDLKEEKTDEQMNWVMRMMEEISDNMDDSRIVKLGRTAKPSKKDSEEEKDK